MADDVFDLTPRRAQDEVGQFIMLALTLSLSKCEGEQATSSASG
jgi:hypothetical protein